MKIRMLDLKNYCGYEKCRFEFDDFAALVGPNGIGKTTVLNAIALLCSSLDFEDRGNDLIKPDGEEASDWVPRTTARQRLKGFLSKCIRNEGEKDQAPGFRIEGRFEHEGKELVSIITEGGFERNDMLSEPWWWQGVYYMAKFDSEMVNFQLPAELWPTFASAYEGITGYMVEPDVYTETDLIDPDMPEEMRPAAESAAAIVIGYWIHKYGSRVHSRRASAGEKKVAKALSQIVNLEPHRQPHIVLVDNMEMHVHPRRHLRMFEEIKDLFSNKQIIATTHSGVIIDQYHPREQVIDIEKLLEAQNGRKPII